VPDGHDPDVAHRVEPFDDPFQVGGRWCFWPASRWDELMPWAWQPGDPMIAQAA
jgi:hypothetical protein|tara:strand:+ start:1190 stop:1351 length:162 start_codon:yes stop_codon:yes gene_type:complete